MKGFTLVELLVVIAIIAILATVSVVGYLSFTKKAKTSADESAVSQMNTLLEALDVEDQPEDVASLFEYLNEAGLDAEDYKPLTSDTYFYWDQTLNRILYVDANNTVLYPEEYASATPDNNWQSLSGTIPEAEVTVDTDGKASISSGAEYVAVSEAIASGTATEVTLSGTVDCMGASISPEKCTATATIGGADSDNVATLKSAVSTDFYQEGQGEHPDKDYNASLFYAEIGSGKTVTIQNLIIENVTVGNYETGSSGIICGELLGGTLNVENVTFKNCTIYGMNKVGIIVGYVQNGTVNLDNVTIENCKVYSSEGEAGIAIGVYNAFYNNGVATTLIVSDVTSTNNTVSVVADEYHDIVTASDGTKYITKIDSYSEAAELKTAGSEYHENGTTYWKVSVATEGVLAWEAPSNDYKKVDGCTFTSSISASSGISECWCRERTAITELKSISVTS